MPWEGLRQGPADPAHRGGRRACCAPRSTGSTGIASEYAQTAQASATARRRCAVDVSGVNVEFGDMRNLIPLEGGRFLNQLDIDRAPAGGLPRRPARQGPVRRGRRCGREQVVGSTARRSWWSASCSEEGAGLHLQRPRQGQGVHPGHDVPGDLRARSTSTTSSSRPPTRRSVESAKKAGDRRPLARQLPLRPDGQRGDSDVGHHREDRVPRHLHARLPRSSSASSAR